MSYIAKLQPLKVLIIDYTYPIFERVVKMTGGQLYQVIPKDPTTPVLVENAMDAMNHFRPNVVVLCNTSNPTGQSNDQHFLDGILKVSKQLRSWLIYDRVCEFDIGPDAEFNCFSTALNSDISTV